MPPSPDQPHWSHQYPSSRTSMRVLAAFAILFATSPLLARIEQDTASRQHAAEPITITRLGRYDTPGFAWDVDVSGATTYVANGFDGVQIVDVQDPSVPRLFGTHRTPGDAQSVSVMGNLAYAVYGADASPSTPPAGVQVVDVGDPARPQLRATLPFSGSVEIVAGLAYVSRAGAFNVYDISDPAAPELLSSVILANEYASALEVEGNFAYLATESSGDMATRLRIIDISDPAQPRLRGQVRLIVQWRFNDLAVANNLVYAAATNGVRTGGSEGELHVYDVSNPDQPLERGVYLTAHDQATSVSVSGNLSYLGSSTPDANRASVELVDVHDPTRPVQLARYDELTAARSLRVVGSRVYVADGAAGLQILSVNFPGTQYLPLILR